MKFCILIFALFSLQIPLVMQLYENQLIGHVAELQWQVNEMTTVASKSDKTLEQYIGKFVTNDDSDVSDQGTIMQTVHFRWQRLTKALEALQTASPLTKPLFFFFYLDPHIFKSTLKAFKPGLPLTVEAGLYALSGAGFAFLIFQTFGILRKKRKRHVEHNSLLEEK